MTREESIQKGKELLEAIQVGFDVDRVLAEADPMFDDEDKRWTFESDELGGLEIDTQRPQHSYTASFKKNVEAKLDASQTRAIFDKTLERLLPLLTPAPLGLQDFQVSTETFPNRYNYMFEFGDSSQGASLGWNSGFISIELSGRVNGFSFELDED